MTEEAGVWVSACGGTKKKITLTPKSCGFSTVLSYIKCMKSHTVYVKVA